MKTAIVFLMALVSLRSFAFISIAAKPHLNEYIATHFETKDGRLCFVFENIPNFSELEANLWQTCQDRKGQFQEAVQILVSENAKYTYIQNAHVVSVEGKNFLYFNAYDKNKDLGFWGRAEISEKMTGPIEWLVTSQSLQNQYRAWIYPKVLSSGEVLMTYEALNLTTKINELHFSVSKDGLHFPDSHVYQIKAQMTRFEEFANGTWAFVYQVGYGAKMMDYIRLSKDRGVTFAEPIAVSSQPNVHDPMYLKRKDGDLDVYIPMATQALT